MNTHALQSSTETKRESVPTARVRAAAGTERSHLSLRPARRHELAAAMASRRSIDAHCGCGCAGSCGTEARKHELERSRTRNPEGSESGEVTTANTQAGAGGHAAVSPSPNCAVASGPAYSPTGSIPVTETGGEKSASFSFSASFTTSSSAKSEPHCCEVHQYIRWNKAFQDWNEGPPHSGFPSSSTFGTWYEDRDSANKRYGHRSGSYSDPIASCGDEYLSGTARDMANGSKYCGNDNPGGPSGMKGTYEFQLKVVDVCNSDAVKASSSVITVKWG